jgi:hypothetical protein
LAAATANQLPFLFPAELRPVTSPPGKQPRAVGSKHLSTRRSRRSKCVRVRIQRATSSRYPVTLREQHPGWTREIASQGGSFPHSGNMAKSGEELGVFRRLIHGLGTKKKRPQWGASIRDLILRLYACSVISRVPSLTQEVAALPRSTADFNPSFFLICSR